ncbi:tyrosine-protein phosphatase [Streptomyces sp. NPDC048514]|uniref:tyrosine-protein phosphatase n=1 Tax=Streptomyces sp. NPDC048514 TaxID=3365564 RepID=UPI00371D991C
MPAAVRWRLTQVSFCRARTGRIRAGSGNEERCGRTTCVRQRATASAVLSGARQVIPCSAGNGRADAGGGVMRRRLGLSRRGSIGHRLRPTAVVTGSGPRRGHRIRPTSGSPDPAHVGVSRLRPTSVFADSGPPTRLSTAAGERALVFTTRPPAAAPALPCGCRVSVFRSQDPRASFPPCFQEALYRGFVTDPGNRAALGAAIHAVANATKAVLFHCSAGKDRTGVLADTILRAVGVPASTSENDYLLSAGLRAPSDKALRDQLETAGYMQDPDLLIPLQEVRGDYLAAFRDQAVRDYGSFGRFLTDGLGLDVLTLARLRARLVG